MMKRCKSCLFKADVDDGICPVCGIDQAKSKKDLSKEQKRIRYAAIGIRSVAVLHLLGGVILLVILPSLLLRYASQGTYSASLILAVVYSFIVGIVFLVLAFGLWKYAKWGYYAAAATYGIILFMNLISPNIGLLVVILSAYCIGNRNARAIFNRSLKLSNV